MSAVETWSLLDTFSHISLHLFLATISVIIYFIYAQFYNDDNWEKYGVKQGSMGITDFRSGCIKLIEQHGDTVGIKRSKMQLVTRDLEVLKNVMVKDFNNFVDRVGVLNTNSLISKGVFFLEGDDWRRVRHVLSPSFSSGKLKNTSKTIDETAAKLASVLEDFAKAGKLVPIKHSTGQYTSEIIAKTAFGLETKCLGGEDDEFTSYCKNLFKSRSKFMNKFMLIFFRFPWLYKFLVKTTRKSTPPLLIKYQRL
uniref:Cytochrome P450 n=1 Tax=Arion vulgaris TaxID=1028688 RepID=A0A0B6ZUH4_9EUPU